MKFCMVGVRGGERRLNRVKLIYLFKVYRKNKRVEVKFQLAILAGRLKTKL